MYTHEKALDPSHQKFCLLSGKALIQREVSIKMQKYGFHPKIIKLKQETVTFVFGLSKIQFP